MPPIHTAPRLHPDKVDVCSRTRTITPPSRETKPQHMGHDSSEGHVMEMAAVATASRVPNPIAAAPLIEIDRVPSILTDQMC
jgi:hypothetical protein